MSNGGDLDRFTVKELLTMFVIPELDRKADAEELKKLERDVQQLQVKILTPESVASMIGVALEKKEARGWTARERVFGVFLLLFAATGAVVAVIQASVALSG